MGSLVFGSVLVAVYLVLQNQVLKKMNQKESNVNWQGFPSKQMDF